MMSLNGPLDEERNKDELRCKYLVQPLPTPRVYCEDRLGGGGCGPAR